MEYFFPILGMIGNSAFLSFHVRVELRPSHIDFQTNSHWSLFLIFWFFILFWILIFLSHHSSWLLLLLTIYQPLSDFSALLIVHPMGNLKIIWLVANPWHPDYWSEIIWNDILSADANLEKFQSSTTNKIRGNLHCIKLRLKFSWTCCFSLGTLIMFVVG